MSSLEEKAVMELAIQKLKEATANVGGSNIPVAVRSVAGAWAMLSEKLWPPPVDQKWLDTAAAACREMCILYGPVLSVDACTLEGGCPGVMVVWERASIDFVCPEDAAGEVYKKALWAGDIGLRPKGV